MAEPLAILYRLLLYSRLGFLNVDVESDCHRVMLALSNNMPMLSEFGSILFDIFAISSKVNVVSYLHCNRVNNTIAHKLAHLALSLENAMIC
ncbi:hypothetical protein F8388_018735 [Cannabis sativa]|uniref:RNase H type-1 domain-containing protein n=1 Tax=Cannabis sativa TaxID=3483 RepID=A0A7J6GM73_CANSA|nr:hypothetical protein F8388_018735 [Cannabis sativa]